MQVVDHTARVPLHEELWRAWPFDVDDYETVAPGCDVTERARHVDVPRVRDRQAGLAHESHLSGRRHVGDLQPLAVADERVAKLHRDRSRSLEGDVSDDLGFERCVDIDGIDARLRADVECRTGERESDSTLETAVLVARKRLRPLEEVVLRITVAEAIDVNDDQAFLGVRDVRIPVHFVQILLPASRCRVFLLAILLADAPAHADRVVRGQDDGRRVLRGDVCILAERRNRSSHGLLGEALVRDVRDVVDPEAAPAACGVEILAAQLQAAKIRPAVVDGLVEDTAAGDKLVKVVRKGKAVQVGTDDRLRLVPLRHAHRVEAPLARADIGVVADEIDETGPEKVGLSEPGVIVVPA